MPWSPGHPLSLLHGQLSCAVRCRRHQPRRATAPACSRRTGRATPRRAPSAGAGQPVWWRPRSEPLPPGWRWPFRTHGPAHAPRSSRPLRWALLTATQCHLGTRRPAPPLAVTLARMRWFAAARPPRRFRVDVPPLPTCRPSAHRRATARRLSVAHTIKNVVRHWAVTDGTDFPLILLEARDAHTSVSRPGITARHTRSQPPTTHRSIITLCSAMDPGHPHGHAITGGHTVPPYAQPEIIGGQRCTSVLARARRRRGPGQAGGLDLRILELAPGLEPGTCCLQGVCRPSGVA
jgi:hypothetical protein